MVEAAEREQRGGTGSAVALAVDGALITWRGRAAVMADVFNLLCSHGTGRPDFF